MKDSEPWYEGLSDYSQGYGWTYAPPIRYYNFQPLMDEDEKVRILIRNKLKQSSFSIVWLDLGYKRGPTPQLQVFAEKWDFTEDYAVEFYRLRQLAVVNDKFSPEDAIVVLKELGYAEYSTPDKSQFNLKRMLDIIKS